MDFREFFQAVYVINPDHRVDRWEPINKQLSDYGFKGVQRISACRPDLSTITPSDYADFHYKPDHWTDSSFDSYLRDSIGYLQSHIKVLELAKSNNVKNYLVFEDDALMIPGSQYYLNKSIAVLLKQPAWDMFYLGGYHYPKRKPVYIDESLDKVRYTYETYAYAVNHTFFDILLSELKECKTKIDHFYSKKIHPQYNVFCSNPIVSRQSGGGMPDITSSVMHAFAHKHPLAVVLNFPRLLFQQMINRFLWRLLFSNSSIEEIWFPIMGGLGNQMFEVAHAVDFAQKMGATPRFIDKVNHSSIVRKWELGCFGIAGEPLNVTRKKILKLWIRTAKKLYWLRTWSPEISTIAAQSLNRIQKKMLKYGTLVARRLCQASRRLPDPEILFEVPLQEECYAGSLHPKVCLGLWQGERYFADSADQVKKMFTFPDLVEIPAGFALDRSKPGVAMHVRRCDYVHHQGMRRYALICDVDWYREALQKMRDSVPGAIFYLFSDDQRWAQEQFGHEPDVSLVRTDPDGPAWVDMALMAQCQHFIIPNSTYSWWAVYLRKNRDSVIIAPRFWSRDPLTPTHEHPVYCEEWQLL